MNTEWLRAVAEGDPSPVVSRASRVVQRVAVQLGGLRRDRRLMERLPSIALVVASAAPWLDDEALALACRMNLWIFMIDDRFDGSTATYEELVSLVEGCQAGAWGVLDVARDEVLVELTHLRRVVSRHPLFENVGRRWSDGVVGVARAMLREWRWAHDYQLRGPAALPSLEAYLANGQESIGVLPHIWLTCMRDDDRTCVPHLLRLAEMASLANRAVRLASDVRSADGDELGGAINSVLIMTHELARRGITQGGARARAVELLNAESAAALAALETLRREPVTATGRAEDGIAAIARELCRFYALRDFGPASRLVRAEPQARTAA